MVKVNLIVSKNEKLRLSQRSQQTLWIKVKCVDMVYVKGVILWAWK